MRISTLDIWPPLLLAPMAGLTHSALRTTILNYGGVGLLSTEMLSASRLPVENEQISPYLVKTPEEQPLSYQLLVGQEKHVSPAIGRLDRLQADCIDFNLGCPAPQARRMGAGSSLAENSKRLQRIMAISRQQTSRPLSAKIRLGESFDAKRLKNFCLMLAGEGIDMLTVHARLRGESFSRKPHWEWGGQVKEWLDIPVVVNGGIDSVASARLCLEQSGADGLMIGRAAAIKPWIFAEIAREIYGLEIATPEPELPLMYATFARALCERFRPERRLGRLKEFTHYFAKNYFFGHHLATRVQSSQSFAEAWQRASEFFAKSDPDFVLPYPLSGLTSEEEDCNSQSRERERQP
ncbi:tRNA-dihydrouridine synthase family protein [Desulfobulbus rhabdoformis]|uniref:tRNA dihydrouridine synthase n=1 Tax=Desulfobulbus rhabdoformis TaxID=34032 RepID=UPI001963CC7D|nr:tRNA-dihydrouridine synthase family protein [Desulfobulbus rhabdoformis]MBM9614319.1 tRNA-dihydrouridine synthase family protein [Desulfobulbus rhabdoformis]